MRTARRSWWRVVQLGLALLLVLSGGLLQPAPVLAATITVTTTADTLANDGQCSLREAILSASTNVALFPFAGECPAGSAVAHDAIVLAAGATYNLTSGVPNASRGATGLPSITGGLTIRGNGATIRRSSGTFRILHVAPNAQVTLNNLTIRNGLAEVVSSTARGGGIYNEGTLSLIAGSTVRNNSLVLNVPSTSLTGKGGGIYSTGSLTITGSSVINNSIAVTNTGTGASGWGGGIYSTGTLTITSSTLSGNSIAATNTGTAAVGYGGALFSEGPLTLTSSSVLNNTVTATNTGTGATAYGGGLASFYFPATMTLTDSEIAGNQATAAITGTSSLASGGGVAFQTAGTLTILRTAIRDNQVTSDNTATGGGLASGLDATVTLDRSTIAGNTATSLDNGGAGGGVAVSDGSLTMTNSTISGNTATGNPADGSSGGGLDLSYQGSATLTQVTIADNEALTNGGGLRHSSSGTLSLTGTIIAGNRTAGQTGQPTADCQITATTPVTGSVNLVGTATGCPVLPNHREVSAAGVFTTVLEPLASNGGTTQTHALKLAAGNLAVDSGDNAICAAAPVTNLDQRGEVRPFDGDNNTTATCDIGAYELRTALPTLSLTTSASVAPASVAVGGTSTITATVTSSLTQTFLVDVEVYNAAGTKVYQQWFDSEPFTATVARQFNVPWTVPAGTPPGTYTVKVGVFIPGWGVLYAWNDAAATITVT